MSSLGEWQDDPDVAQAVQESAQSAVQEQMIGRLTAEAMGDEVNAAVGREIRKIITPMIQQAVSDAMTPDRIESLQAQAHKAAEAHLNPAAEDASTSASDQDPEPYFKSVDEWVREYFCPLFRRRIDSRNGSRWAADWWRYPEAVARLDALWLSWEALRLDRSMGMSVWLRDHADHHTRILFSESGPFETSDLESPPGEPLPYIAPPPGLYN